MTKPLGQDPHLAEQDLAAGGVCKWAVARVRRGRHTLLSIELQMERIKSKQAAPCICFTAQWTDRLSLGRWPLHPEEIALVLAEQPSAQALVSEDILSPLVSPAGGQAQSMRGRADVGGGPPGAQRRGAADISITTAHALRSPPALASPMQLARASIQQWGKPRGSVSPSSESMVICGPTWSFPVETSSPTRSSAREPQAALRPAHLGSTAPSAALQGPSRSGVDHYSCDVDEGNMAMQPEERSISFRYIPPSHRGMLRCHKRKLCNSLISLPFWVAWHVILEASELGDVRTIPMTGIYSMCNVTVFLGPSVTEDVCTGAARSLPRCQTWLRCRQPSEGSPGPGSLMQSAPRAGSCLTWRLQSVRSRCSHCRPLPNRHAFHGLYS